MAQHFHYAAVGSNNWDVDLATVRLGTTSFTDLAEHGEVGTTSLVIPDPDGFIGHNGDAIIGLQAFYVFEDAAATSNHVFRGFTRERRYRRRADSDRWSAERDIEVTLADGNEILSNRVIWGADGNRPSETVAARLRWLLGSQYLNGLAAGYVTYDTTVLDPDDTRSKKPGEVLADMAIAIGFNYFVYWDDLNARYALWFGDSNTSTDYTSPISVSNVLTDLTLDANGGVTGNVYPPYRDATLVRDPSRVVSETLLPYAGTPAAFRQRHSTATTYGWHGGVAPNSTVKTLAAANTIADRFLLENRTEDDRLSFSVQLPAAKVGLLRAGQRMQVTFSHLPGYTTATWVRVVRRTVAQDEQTDQLYTMTVEATPQENFQASIYQSVSNEHDAGGVRITLPNPVVAGDLLILVEARRNAGGGYTAPATLSPAIYGAPSDYRTFTVIASGITRAADVAGPDAINLAYRIATGDEQDLLLSVNNVLVTLYECRGATIVGAGIKSASSAGPAAIKALAAFGTGGALQIAGYIVDHSDGTALTATVGTGWTKDYDTNQGAFNDGHPEFVTMHGTSATQASISNASNEFAAVAVDLQLG